MAGEEESPDSESSFSRGNKTMSDGGNGENLPPIYQLPLSESPVKMLVGDVLTATNYCEWVLDMKDTLLAKNKFSFVDGTTPKRDARAQSNAWIRCDAMVKGWMKTAMDKEIRSNGQFTETSREIWLDLKGRFDKGNASCAYEL
ncbi:unnamed protein product [Linum trigynum]|uniref:Retrotransposon Copia-like N-terminal domain-containing protein n=1 Tax=Linum trigynum TaxID=586398 RepID=A0AAV2FNQ7_9ROSI